jgi:hypothetical protein
MRTVLQAKFELIQQTDLTLGSLYGFYYNKKVFLLCEKSPCSYFWLFFETGAGLHFLLKEHKSPEAAFADAISIVGGITAEKEPVNIFEFASFEEFIQWAYRVVITGQANHIPCVKEPTPLPGQTDFPTDMGPIKKVALFCYHKNVNGIYPPEWIEKYKQSVIGQTFKDFDIFEFNYGGGNERIFENSYFESFAYPNFVHALQYLMDKVFSSGYEFAFNSNVDDWMDPSWMESLLSDAGKGYDLVSSNFCLVRGDQVTEEHKFHQRDIKKELESENNVICHPAVLYTKGFWEKYRYNADEMPVEDLRLWQRAVRGGAKIFINEKNLLFHRLHSLSVTQSENK